MFFIVKNLPLAPQYRKRLLQIFVIFVRNIHNHAKVEKLARHVTTSDDGSWAW